MMRIRAAIAAAVIGVVGITSAVPASATTDSDVCRIMGPEYVEDAIACVCRILSLLEDGSLVCDPA